jgi:hypothetical protein
MRWSRRAVTGPWVLGTLLLGASVAHAEPTRISVRVLSKDAKFIGTTMGGMWVTIRDVETGELLAEGRTEGGTGETDRIMKLPWTRGTPLWSEGAASFTATIDIDTPHHIEVAARGPQAQLQSSNVVSATQWVVPGKHVDQGDAFLLVLPGFAVDVLDPPVHTRVGTAPTKVTVRANLVML